MKAIIDGLLVLPHEIVTGQVLMYEEDIWKIVPRRQFRAGMCTELIDANGGFVVPGFINEHIHGCAGSDTMDDDDQALAAMQKALPATGVTSFVPTTMTAARPAVEKALERIRTAMVADREGAQILGAHMEGPFISADYKGAQDGTYIEKADFSWIAPYADTVKIVTLAPETLQSSRFLEECSRQGIVVSFGHSGATYEQAVEASQLCSVCHATHVYNAMGPFHHRHPGLIGAALANPDIHCELLCDDIHVHPGAQKVLYQAKGRDGIILVTDSMRACLLPDGESELGGQKVFVQNGQARLADGTLAGSTAAMNDVIYHFLVNTGASLPDAVAMATINPAKDLGVYDRLGSLEEGKQADMVVLDSTDFHVKQTVIAGSLVYNEDDSRAN